MRRGQAIHHLLSESEERIANSIWEWERRRHSGRLPPQPKPVFWTADGTPVQKVAKGSRALARMRKGEPVLGMGEDLEFAVRQPLMQVGHHRRRNEGAGIRVHDKNGAFNLGELRGKIGADQDAQG